MCYFYSKFIQYYTKLYFFFHFSLRAYTMRWLWTSWTIISAFPTQSTYPITKWWHCPIPRTDPTARFTHLVGKCIKVPINITVASLNVFFFFNLKMLQCLVLSVIKTKRKTLIFSKMFQKTEYYVFACIIDITGILKLIKNTAWHGLKHLSMMVMVTTVIITIFRDGFFFVIKKNIFNVKTLRFWFLFIGYYENDDK